MHYAPLQPGPLVHTTACLEYAQPQPARPAHHTDIVSTRRLEGWREYFRVTEEKEAQRAREHSRRAHNGKQTTRPSHPRTSPAANSTPHVWAHSPRNTSQRSGAMRAERESEDWRSVLGLPSPSGTIALVGNALVGIALAGSTLIGSTLDGTTLNGATPSGATLDGVARLPQQSRPTSSPAVASQPVRIGSPQHTDRAWTAHVAPTVHERAAACPCGCSSVRPSICIRGV